MNVVTAQKVGQGIRIVDGDQSGTVPGVAIIDPLTGAPLTSYGVHISSRIVVDQRTVTAPATTGVTLASLYGGTIPSGAVAAEIQADGGTVRIGLTPTLVTTATGVRLDDGVLRTVDSVLADVSVVGKTVAVPLNIVMYDRL